MLFHEVPPFDILTQQTTPYSGFGETHLYISEPPRAYLQTVDQAVTRVNDVFDRSCDCGIDTIREVEEIIDQMWAERWNPQEADINLFTTDFGCLVAEALRCSLDGTLVLRLETNLSHASIWWPKATLEAFPFHATYKRLNSNDGQSLTSLAERLSSLVK